MTTTILFRKVCGQQGREALLLWMVETPVCVDGEENTDCRESSPQTETTSGCCPQADTGLLCLGIGDPVTMWVLLGGSLGRGADDSRVCAPWCLFREIIGWEQLRTALLP